MSYFIFQRMHYTFFNTKYLFTLQRVRPFVVSFTDNFMGVLIFIEVLRIEFNSNIIWTKFSISEKLLKCFIFTKTTFCYQNNFLLAKFLYTKIISFFKTKYFSTEIKIHYKMRKLKYTYKSSLFQMFTLERSQIFHVATKEKYLKLITCHLLHK